MVGRASWETLVVVSAVQFSWTLLIFSASCSYSQVQEFDSLSAEPAAQVLGDSRDSRGQASTTSVRVWVSLKCVVESIVWCRCQLRISGQFFLTILSWDSPPHGFSTEAMRANPRVTKWYTKFGSSSVTNHTSCSPPNSFGTEAMGMEPQTLECYSKFWSLEPILSSAHLAWGCPGVLLRIWFG